MSSSTQFGLEHMYISFRIFSWFSGDPCPAQRTDCQPRYLASTQPPVHVSHAYSSFRLVSGASCCVLLECTCSCIHREARGDDNIEKRKVASLLLPLVGFFAEFMALQSGWQLRKGGTQRSTQAIAHGSSCFALRVAFLKKLSCGTIRLLLASQGGLLLMELADGGISNSRFLRPCCEPKLLISLGCGAVGNGCCCLWWFLAIDIRSLEWATRLREGRMG